MPFKPGYQKFIEDNFDITNKKNELVPFKLNKIQTEFISVDADPHRNVILKARQQGFSSLILAIYTTDFLLKDFSHSVIVADNRENAEGLLERVKLYIESYESRKGFKINLKYNTKNELYNKDTRSKYTIGTAQNVQFGRSKTITNLHLSEAAFFPNMQKLLSSALQAVTEDGQAIIETTAHGYSSFRDFWMEGLAGPRNFKPSCYGASQFYSQEFLEKKKAELGRDYQQEYPENWMEAFLASGDTYFDKQALEYYLANSIDPIHEFQYGMYNFAGAR
jgi:hypothetical protein